MEQTISSYSESNQNANILIGNASVNSGIGQSFAGDDNYITSAVFYLRKTGVPPFDLRAKLYAHSGSFGSTGVATGEALAVSELVLTSSISTSYELVTFNFTGDQRVQAQSGTNYVIMCELVGAIGDISNQIQVGSDSTSPTHPGNQSKNDGDGTFSLGYFAPDEYDTCFYLYGVADLSYILDQSNTALTNTTDNFGQTSFTRVAQGFTPSVSAGVSRIVLELRRVGTVADNVFVQICEDNGGEPGTVVGTSVDVVGSTINTTNTTVTFDFSPTTTAIIAGSVYWIVVARDGALSDINYYRIRGVVPSSYPSGENSVEISSSWFDGNDTDEYFEQYYDNSTVILPRSPGHNFPLLGIG